MSREQGPRAAGMGAAAIAAGRRRRGGGVDGRGGFEGGGMSRAPARP